MSWTVLRCCRPNCSVVPQRPWSGKAYRPPWRVPVPPHHAATGTVPSAGADEAQPTQTGHWSWGKPAVELQWGQVCAGSLDCSQLMYLAPEVKSVDKRIDKGIKIKINTCRKKRKREMGKQKLKERTDSSKIREKTFVLGYFKYFTAAL